MFHWEDIMEYTVSQGKPLKYVIDLTFTDKYYQSHDLPKGVHHCKFLVPGKRMPRQDQITSILNIMKKASNENVAVGIHCTHGKNRTGLMTVWYLVEVLKMDVEEAITAFEIARKTKLECDIYLEALRAIGKNPTVENGLSLHRKEKSNVEETSIAAESSGDQIKFIDFEKNLPVENTTINEMIGEKIISLDVSHDLFSNGDQKTSAILSSV